MPQRIKELIKLYYATSIAQFFNIGNKASTRKEWTLSSKHYEFQAFAKENMRYPFSLIWNQKITKALMLSNTFVICELEYNLQIKKLTT